MRLLPLTAALAVLSGCATTKVEPPTLTAESGAAGYEARSLRDEGLRRFLRDNLGHEPESWDFETLCWVGFYYHPSLEVARAQWTTARAAQQTAAQRTNPTLTLTPGYNFTREAGVSPWMPAVNADILLPTAGKRARQQDVAAADAEAARLGVVTAAWALRSELRKALVDADASSRRAATLQAQADVEQRLLALLEQRYQAGSVSATEVSTVRTARLRAESAAADAATQAATARARVATALGLPLHALEGVALPVPPPLPLLSESDLSAARRRALRTRADVVAALAKYRSAQASLELELAKRWPDIHLGPGYQWDQGANKWSLGLTIELPVFNRNEGPIAEAVARRTEAAAQFNQVQNQATGAIDVALAGLQAASAQLARARALHAEVQRQVTQAEQRLNLGAADQVEVQSARLDLATAEAGLLDAETAAANTAGELEDALQLPFPNVGALAEPPASRGRSQP